MLIHILLEQTTFIVYSTAFFINVNIVKNLHLLRYVYVLSMEFMCCFHHGFFIVFDFKYVFTIFFSVFLSVFLPPLFSFLFS